MRLLFTYEIAGELYTQLGENIGKYREIAERNLIKDMPGLLKKQNINFEEVPSVEFYSHHENAKRYRLELMVTPLNEWLEFRNTLKHLLKQGNVDPVTFELIGQLVKKIEN